MAITTLKQSTESVRTAAVPQITTVFVTEGRMHHSRCRGALDFMGRRAALELVFYCRTCCETITLPEFAVARVPAR